MNKNVTQNSIIAHFLKVFGGKWKFLIIYYLNQQPQRFSNLEKKLVCISRKVLVDQLRILENEGLIIKEEFVSKPPKYVKYSLSDCGKELVPHIEGIVLWSEKYFPEIKRISALD